MGCKVTTTNDVCKPLARKLMRELVCLTKQRVMKETWFMTLETLSVHVAIQLTFYSGLYRDSR